MAKRELERRRRHFRQVIMPAVALVAIAGVVGAYVITLPPPPPPHELGPGEYYSDADMHIHPHLAIYNGAQLASIPAQIGIDASLWNDHTLDRYSLDGPQLSPLHTHDTSGTIHVESLVTRGFTLGEFFAVWGQPFSPSQVLNLHADSAHRLTLTVDGKPSSAWANVVFHESEQIEVHYDAV